MLSYYKERLHEYLYDANVDVWKNSMKCIDSSDIYIESEYSNVKFAQLTFRLNYCDKDLNAECASEVEIKEYFSSYAKKYSVNFNSMIFVIQKQIEMGDSSDPIKEVKKPYFV